MGVRKQNRERGRGKRENEREKERYRWTGKKTVVDRQNRDRER